jgi:hydroxylamine reductase (hybrid-cluster protein)
VAVFLTMLHLGIQNIHLGPQLPAFVSPNVLKVLQDTYGLKPVSLDDHDRVSRMLLFASSRTPPSSYLSFPH